MEERRFSAASVSKKDSRALAPVASDADIFRAFVKAGKRPSENPRAPRTTTRIQARENREERKTARLPRHRDEVKQGQIHAHRQPVPNPKRHPEPWKSRASTAPDDLQYILRFIGQAVTLSLETAKIVAGFPKLQIAEASKAGSTAGLCIFPTGQAPTKYP